VSELRELYQAVILDHNKKPRNFGELPDANRTARGDNPLCGDKLRLELRVEDGVVADVAFTGQGCAISTASASLMTEAVKGRPLAEVERLFDAFHQLVTGPPAREPAAAGLGKLAVFAGVREFPIRVKCATLAWHTLRAALEQRGETVKTE
jgi:nitrogen fixation NifU-like protein